MWVSSPSPAVSRLLALVGLGVLAAGVGWFRTADDATRFLDSRGPARWIVYPTPPDLSLQPMTGRTARFRRTFSLAIPPTTARLHVRGMTAVHAALNGTVLPAATVGASWKQTAVYDVAGQLRPGTNQLDVQVTNHDGPPALWLWLDAGGGSLVSDSQWEASVEGSTWQPARPASVPASGDLGGLYGRVERTGESLASRWLIILLFAGLAGALVIGLLGLTRGRFAHLPGLVSPVPALLAVGGIWLLLIGHNLGALSYPVGFDFQPHLDYIRYLQEKRHLPLAGAGFEMSQPPLFYLLAAAAATVAGLSTADFGMVVLLRGLALVFALAQTALTFASLRLLFPGRPRPQAFGVVLAAFLPMSLYLAHYPGNDLLAGTWSALAVYLCLRILQQPQASARAYLGLGLTLGAAVLTKLTALAVVPAVLLVLAARLVRQRQFTPGEWLRSVGTAALGCAAVCGWFFWRNWRHYGTPVIAAYDPASGFRWWQDPGYSTLAYLFRFGHTLVSPFFSEFHSLPDGLYSTLWGDGLWGGAAASTARPPWNYDLMAVGYLLALLPTAGLLIGVAAAVVELVRRPRADWCLLLAVGLASFGAVTWHFLKMPYFCHVKAFYALPALTPLCALAARGLDLVAGGGRLRGALLGTALGTWALTAYASFWVVSDAPATLVWTGRQLFKRERRLEALDRFRAAVRMAPNDADARLALGGLWLELGRNEQAAAEFTRLVRDHPEVAMGHYYLAYLRGQEQRSDEAVAHMRRALELAPDFADGYVMLSQLLGRQAQNDAAVTAMRRAVGLRPGDPVLHTRLAQALAAAGPADEAIAHYRTALRAKPDLPDALIGLAQLYATHKDARVRNGPEAVALAERACALTGQSQPAYLATLAAAYAETGRFAEAVRTLEAVIDRAMTAGQTEWVAAMQPRLALYRSGRPYRE